METKRAATHLTGLLLALMVGCAAAPDPLPPSSGRSTPSQPVAVGAREAITPTLSAEALGQGLWLIVDAEPWAANSLVAALDDGTLLLLDTPWTEEGAAALLGWARRRFGEGRRVVAINTHFHPDAMGGNGALLRAGVEVYTSAGTVAALAERGERMRAQLLEALGDRAEWRWVFAEARWIPGDHIFDPMKPLVLTFGQDTVEVFYPGAGHAPDNVVVYLARPGVLFGGCMLRGGDSVGNLGDADLDAWAEAVRALMARYEPTFTVAGHGPCCRPDGLAHTLRVVEAARAKPAP